MLAAFFGVALLGCGGGDRPGQVADAGPDATLGWTPTAPDAPEPPAEPAPPASPDLACPAGWRAVADATDPGVFVCDPWPESGAADCAPDEAHFPGAAGCERVGSACGAGDFADDLPVGVPTLYVDPAAAPGGDGSEAAPLAAIADALAVAEDDSVVALAIGTYDEAVTVDGPVTLWGACVAGTILAPSVPSETDATVTFSGRGGGSIRNLSIDAGRLGVAVTTDGVALDSVVIDRAVVRALWVGAGGVAVATSLVVRDTDGRPSDGAFGFAVEALGGGSLDVSRAVLSGGRTAEGLAVDAGSLLRLADTSVADTRPRESDARNGVGVDALGGATLRLERVVVERTHRAGVLVSDPGTSLLASDLLVRDVFAQESDGVDGDGVSAFGGASVRLDRVAVARARTEGIVIRDPGTALDARDVVVVDTSPDATGLVGMGVVVDGGATAGIERIAAFRNGAVGVRASEGASLTGSDVVVRATAADSTGNGAGIDVLSGSIATLRRVVSEGNALSGVSVHGAGSWLDASDVAISGTLETPAGFGGQGLQVIEGASADLERARLEGNRFLGVVVEGEGSSLAATDLSVVRTAARAGDGLFGDALDVLSGADATLTRASLEENDTAGIFVVGSTLDATDLSVSDTRAEPADGRWGRGLELGAGANVTLSRAAFVGNVSEGVVVLDGSVLDATDLVVRDTRSRPLDGDVGEGIVVGAESESTIERATFASNQRVGVLALEGGRITLLEVDVTDTRTADCGDACAAGGNGMDAVLRGAIVATSFRSSGNVLCGIQVAADGEADLRSGEVSENAVGANVSVEGYDFSRLQAGVVYRDNETTLDTTALPIPGPVDIDR